MSPRLFLLVLCAMLIAIVPVTAQSEDVLPPHVTSIQPLTGVPVTADGVLTITFNQPMESASLTFAPEVAGTIDWPNPLTLTFTPVEAWPVGVDYVVTLNATGASGVDLAQPETFELLGMPPLTVVSVTPSAEANAVSADTELLIGFDRPMVTIEQVGDKITDPAAQLVTLYSGDRTVRGTGAWVSSSLYSFIAQDPLPGGMRYTATVAAGVIAVDGTRLAEPYSWSFATVLPNVLAVEATDERNAGTLQPDSDIQVIFSQPMDRTMTEAVVELRRLERVASHYIAFNGGGEIVPVQYRWQEDDHVLVLDPVDLLPVNNTYALIFTGDTQSATGARAIIGRNELALGPITYEPNAISPRFGEVVEPGVRRVNFDFGMPMDNESFRDHYRIVPEPSGEVTPYMLNDDYTFALQFDHADDTAYTVTLLAGIQNQWGHIWPIDISTTYMVQANAPADQKTWVSLQTPKFVTIPAYQPSPAINLLVRGQPTAEFDIYHASIELMVQGELDVYYFGTLRDPYQVPYSIYDPAEYANWQPNVPWVSDENRLHHWTQTFTPPTEPAEDDENDSNDSYDGYVPVTLADGEPLPLGLYGLEFSSPFIDRYVGRDGFLFAVANVGISVKAGADGESVIWVTDLQTGVPVPGATVTIYGAENEVKISGVTDDAGVFSVPRGTFDAGLSSVYGFRSYSSDRYVGINFIEVTGADRYGVWINGDVYSPRDARNYLYTDRPVYRPGETVYFRGVLRDRLDTTYTVPPTVTTAHVQVGRWNNDYRNPTLVDVFHEVDLAVTEFGTFSGSFDIPHDLALSSSGYRPDYIIRITACEAEWAYANCEQYVQTIAFGVSEFRVPEFEVEVFANQDEVIAGEKLDVDVQAAYYFGGALNGGEVSWRVFSRPGWFDYTGEERGYSFGRYGGRIGSNAGSGSGRLNATGQFHVDAEAVNVYYDASRPAVITLEATVRDESDQPISAVSDPIIVHPAAVYIGLRTEDRFQPTDAPFDIDVFTVNLQSETVSDQPVIIEVIAHRWVRTATDYGYYEWEDVEIAVETVVVETDTAGYAAYQFNAPYAGRFEVVARTQDNRGNLAQTVIWVYAQDRYATDTRVWWMGDDRFWWDDFFHGYPAIQLLAEQTQYVPGDTAEVLIPNPFDEPVEVLVTIERAGVIRYEVVRIEGDALVYRFDVTDEHAPGVWVSIVMLRGGTAEEPDPTYRFGRIELEVEPVARRLNVELTPSAASFAPRDEASFDVRVTDANGTPVQAEVGLHLTDDAVLALRPPNSATLEDAFYSDTTLWVLVTSSHSTLLTAPQLGAQPAYSMGGGGGGGNPALIRDDFVYTPLWAPHVVTDEDGRATVSVTLPDNLTRWRLDARAVTLDTNVGQAETTVISTLPLIVRPDVPRYFVVGDQLPVIGIINNQTTEPQTVTVTLESTGLRLLDGIPVTQTVEVAAGQRQAVEWPVIVEDVPGVDLTLYAEAASGLSDAVKPALRTGPGDTVMVYRYTAPEMMATSGALTEAGRALEGLLFPADIEPLGGELTVQLESSLVAPITGGLDYLREYPHFCVEQTVSRFYPNLMTSQLLADLGADDPDLVANLRANIEPALEKLIAEQNADGGWGWFGRMESHPYVTAYVLLALAEAADAGYTVPDETFSAATAFLNGYLVDLEILPTLPDYQFNRAAFAIYALARAGAFPQEPYDQMLDYRPRLSSTALAHLALVAETSGNRDLALSLADDLLDRALVTGTGTQWVDTRDSYNWSSNTRTTATVTLALIRLQPDHPLLPGAIRWLMTARRADHWPTTQETAWTVLALGEWLRYTDELNGAYEYVLTLNGTELAASAITPAAIQASQGDETVLTVEISDLLADDVNLLDISRSTGPGTLYYVAGVHVEWPADEVEALSRGITVERSYRNVERDWQIIDHTAVGQLVQVRLDFTLDQDTHYFVLEDVLPAGLEVLDTNLLTTSRAVDTPRVTNGERYWWWWRYFDRIEARDTGAVIYADYLPRGRYTFTYTVQATQSGTFQAIPAQGYAFYTPEVFGRSDGAVFTVKDQ